MWNRIRSAAEWVPNGDLAETDVISGKTFYNLNRIQKTGTLIYSGNAVASEVCIGRTFYSNDGTLKTGTSVVIGDPCGGGRIAYVLSPGDSGYDANVSHGLISAITDQAVSAWGCSGVDIPGASGTVIGTGHQNTHDMVAAGCTAASLAESYTGGGFTDWYIPSYLELDKLRINKDLIGNTTNSYYWSSSEDGSLSAWRQSLGTSPTNYGTGKTNIYPIRLVRSF